MQVLDFTTGIDCGVRGNLKQFSPTGFSPVADQLSTWSIDSLAEISFRLPPLRHDLRISSLVAPFLVEEAWLTKQDCWVYLNGLFVYFSSITEACEISFAVSREMISPRVNRLSFVMPNATAPKELNRGEDIRKLGLAFTRVAAAQV
ncbi:MAG: hypothetical protein JO307_17695 [Bryobacterales bacterium]|nr:hypothetical protein [Alphaproteobacteria bacterium]MBV8844644.1 hypothetical protein [Bryobacterales bacterium]MBV9016697.1 hypothetical protein [Alphaproteobacteria bacterium]MBV9152200.1 hypothetical protein [Alphaproteobacteria bacterium]MBV9967268.1 hypothetical protein [Alphaproteobacteria bacterium]